MNLQQILRMPYSHIENVTFTFNENLAKCITLQEITEVMNRGLEQRKGFHFFNIKVIKMSEE